MEASQLLLLRQRSALPREPQELQDSEVQPQRRLQVEVYLEAQHPPLVDCLAQHHKASQTRQPSQQDPSLEVEVRQLLDHCSEELLALSQQYLDHYLAVHRLRRLLLARSKVKLKEVNRSLEGLHFLRARQEAQLLVVVVLRLQNQHSVEHHPQVEASLVALELGQAACSVVRSPVASVVHLLRQHQVRRLEVLQLKVDLVVAASSEVEVEPHQAASSAVRQLLHHLEELQQVEEVVSLAALPPKLKEALYSVDHQPQHHLAVAKLLDQES